MFIHIYILKYNLSLHDVICMYVFRANDLVLSNTVDLPKGRLFFSLTAFLRCLLVPQMSINVEAWWAVPFT